MEFPVTNKIVKILKFIHKNEQCTLTDIKEKFPQLDFMDLVNLGLVDYLVCTRPGEIPTQFKDGNFFIPDNATFWATPHTTKFLEDRRRAWLQWVIPNIISGIALIVSTITILITRLQ